MVLSGVSKKMRVVTVFALVALLVTVAFGVHGAGSAEGRQPYVVEFEEMGYLSCAAAYKALQGADLCRRFDVSSKSIFEFPMDARPSAVVLALQAEDGPLAADALRMYIDRPAGLHGHGVSGPPPLQAVLVIEDDQWAGWDQPSVLRLDVRPDHAAALPQVAVQQDIQVCVGIFYNGADVPADYHPCPE